jgi:hypothetical protein
MAQTNDTIDGLLAEFRGYSAGMPASYHVTMSWADFRKMLERLEAAHRRERGDCAKLRKALCEILSYIESFHKYITPGKGKKLNALFAVADTIRTKARAALAEPPRNCDVGTAEEQQARHCAWCRKHGIDGDNKVNCAHPDTSCDLCALRWAQMPYEEGDAK